MLIEIENLLSWEEIKRCQELLKQADWADGKHTAGLQSAKVKNNLQLPESAKELPELRKIIFLNLQRHATFFSASLPRRVFPPLFNKYTGETNSFGNHVDNAIRTIAGTSEHMRTDLSCTVFLNDPENYDGGELVIEDTYGTKSVKLNAGNAILYPATSLHRITPVTKGERIASFFWVESLVREDEKRRILYELDLSIIELRSNFGDAGSVIRLTNCYHNLMRMWSVA